MIRVFERKAGFALPTILIASMVMLTVLITSVSATSSVRSGLDGQYYSQLAREAAESGLARANGCLQDSGYIPGWSGSALYPNTTCSGGNPCTNAATCFVTSRPTIRTTFTIGTPENMTVSQLLRSEGKVELLRASNGEVWRTYTYTATARVSAELNFGTVAFGYLGASGGYFATIAADGKLQAVGRNQYGQLGNGTTTNTLTPTKFKLSGNDKATAIFTNFLSNGINMFALTDKGTIWGAGKNDNGQLGDGTFTTPLSNPVKFNLPPGVSGRFVSVAGHTTYVLGSDNNIYSAGNCASGLLGYSYTIAGCANKSTYNKVNLPTPTTSDLNTLPTTNIVSDYLSTFVRMQGGRVYGWGDNAQGQFGNETVTAASSPVKMGTFGDTGKPKAVSIGTDGVTLWIVDDSGKAWAAGRNDYGQTGGGDISMKLDSLGECLDNVGSNGVAMQFYPCNDGTAQEYTWRNDKTLFNNASTKCLNVSTTDSVTVNLATCNGTNYQKWTFRNDRTIMNTQTGKCLNNEQNDGVTVIVYTCGAYTNEYFTLPDVDDFNPITLPPGAGSVIKVATDQWSASLLTDTGEVYSFGINAKGQLGAGFTGIYQPAPVKFILPGGVTAKDVTSAMYGGGSSNYVNTFVVGSDGKVYGAGANNYGQLGDGTTTDRSTPVVMQVINGTTVRAKEVLSGNGTTVILTEDKKIYTVGNNANGELGDGTTTNSSTPKANRYTNILPVTSF